MTQNNWDTAPRQSAGGDIVDRLRAALQTQGPNLIAAYLFGSVARGSAGADSDLDIGVLYRETCIAELRRLGNPSAVAAIRSRLGTA